MTKQIKSQQLTPNLRPPPPLLNLVDEEFDELMEDLEEGQIGSNRADSSHANVNEAAPNKKLKSIIIVECPRINESTFRGTINYKEAKENIFKTKLGKQKVQHRILIKMLNFSF